MRLLLCLIIVSVTLTNCYVSQSSNTYAPVKKVVEPNQYIDFVEEGEVLIDYGYHYMVTKNALGTHIRRQFYPEKNLMIEYCEYTDRLLNTKEGMFKSYTDDGKLYSEGQYLNNLKEGSWKHMYLYESQTGDYVNGKKEGQWQSLDTIGIKTIYSCSDNRRQGSFKRYNQHGALLKTGEYIDNKEVGAKLPTTEMPYLKEFEVVSDVKERQQMSQSEMLSQLYKTLRYPALARENNVQGMAIVQFMIKKDGSVANTKVIRGICEPIAKACLDAVKAIGPWNPGTIEGTVADIMYTLPIRFKLEG